MKKIILEVKGKKYHLKEGYTMELGKHEYAFKNKDDADHARMLLQSRVPLSDLGDALNRARIPFQRVDITTPQEFHGNYDYNNQDTLFESSSTALRTIRRAVRMLLAEYKRNSKNHEVFGILDYAIHDLKRHAKEIEEIVAADDFTVK